MQYLDNLVDFGFFQKVESYYVLHDLMHDLAQQVSYECDTITGLQCKSIRPGIRHLSIITTCHDKDADENFPSEKFEQILQNIRPLRKLRSLMFFGQSSVNLLKSIHTLCNEAKCLRLLRVYVSSADISSIHNLLRPYHLRYLEFICAPTRHSLSYVYESAAFPRSLTSFYHLQVLNVGFSGKLTVPADMNKLINLRHLIAHDEVYYVIAGIGNMTSLQELKFKVQNVGNFEIRQLQSMNELVMLEVSHLENVISKVEVSRARLIDKKYLKELFLSWDGDNMNLEPNITKEVLEGLQPQQNLKTLRITGYNGPTSPAWLSSSLSVTSLETLHLENCRELRSLGSLEMLPVLRKLKLMKMWNLVELSIPSLEQLILTEMPKLQKCVGTYGTELTSHLRILMIKNCPQLNEFTPFQSYSSFEAEQKLWFPSLNKLTIECCPHISKWKVLALGEMQALKKLKLINLLAIRELSVPSLEKLVLIGMPSLEFCSGLTVSPLQISTSQGDHKEWLSGLRKLTIHDCPCLLVSHPLPPSAMMSQLSIKGIPTFPTMDKKYGCTIHSNKLIVLDDKILAFHNHKGIRLLFIQDCPNLSSLSTEGLNQLTYLDELHIRNCPNLIIPSSIVLPSLTSISVQACGASGSWLTAMLPHVWSLKHLILSDSAKDEQLLKIPSNVLHSLSKLVISNWPDLEFGGEEGDLRGCISLKYLSIQRCSKLVPLLVSGNLDVGSLPLSLRTLLIDLGPQPPAAWDLKQGDYHIPLLAPSLETLYISNLTDKVQNQLLSCLPTIKKLVIRESPELTSIQLGYSKALRELAIIDCQSLASIKGFESLTNLWFLTVFNSPSLHSSLELLSQKQGASAIWSRLEKLRIDDSSVLTKSLCKQLTSLRWLCFWPEQTNRGATMIGLTEEQESALQLLKTLERINFWYLPNLLSLPSNLHSLTCLKTLDIAGCPCIPRLPDMGLPPSLRELSVHWCSDELRMQCRMLATEKLKTGAMEDFARLLLFSPPLVPCEMMGLIGNVVDAAIGCLVQSILGKFFTEHLEVWTREVGLDEDVKKLEFEMRNAEMVLAASQGRKIDNKPLARSLDDVKELLYDAEDIMDELDYYQLQHHIKQGNGRIAATGNNPKANYESSSTPSSPNKLIVSARSQITSWVSSERKRKRVEEEPADCTLMSPEIKHDISKRINGISNNLHKISYFIQGFLQLDISHLASTLNQRKNMSSNTRLTSSLPTEPKVYGRDADRDMIIDLLINEGSSDLGVLPIVGIGGIGKTTLARFVYRDQRIINHFDLQIWICVSTSFDEVRLTLEILEHVCKDRQEYKDISNFNVLQEILLKNITGKRFLLILDDMWEDKDRSGWDKLLAPMKCNQVRGCMVLATTRRNSVAEMIGTVSAFQIKGLDEKEFWLFFKACAFGNENYEGHPSLQSIGKQIAKALKGCPLAARSVGTLLNRNVSYEHWRTVQDEWKSLQVKDDDIIPILKLSYDYLPFCLQRCFSYCSLFPEDHQFKGETLVQAWISQNFVQCEDTGMRLEEAGMQYLDSLVDFGFFQKVDSHYLLHDLMHDLAQHVSYECDTIIGLQCKTIQPGIRHLSIITTSHDKDADENLPCEKFEEILQNIKPLQKLRTLMFFGQSSVKLLNFIHTLCKEVKCLRLLRVYVSSADISSLFNLLRPYHLRYLEFICAPTRYALAYVYERAAFPQSLTSFYHLQVLNVGVCGKLSVPADMNNLINLRHLFAHDNVFYAIADIGNMTCLQELKFKVQNVGSFEIRQLESMNELVKLAISHLENVITKVDASRARLLDKKYLKELSLSWDADSMSLELERTKEVLEGLQPQQNLKTLRITGYSGSTSPTWLSSNLSVTSLQTLHLEKCRELRILGSLEMLPVLRKLKLIKMWNLVELSIPSLEQLTLIEMPKLEKCFGSYGIELTSHLRVLIIKNCPQLNEFTPLQSYSSFEAEQKSWFPSLNKLTVECCRHISKWNILALGEMQALKKLKLIGLDAIRELSVPSLEKLVLIRMPSLTCCSGLTASLLQITTPQGDQKDWLSGLCKLTIHDCPCLIVSCPLPPSAKMSHLSIKGNPALPTMDKKYGCTIQSSELIVLDDKILAFQNLKGIRLLFIKDCPNLMSLSSEGLNQLTDLDELHIRNCPNLIIPSSLVLPSLTSLYVQACGASGRWLTKMLPHVRSLKHLTLSGPSARDEHLLKIPSNVLHSLSKLVISNCPYVEFCGKEGALRGCTSLKYLSIQRCPKLAPLLVNGKVDVGLLPLSLRILFIDMGLVLPASWDLKKIGIQIPVLLPSLETLYISNLTDKVQSRMLSCLPTIAKLFIRESPELTSLQLGYSKALRELGIIDCESLASIEGFGSLTNLRSLTVYGSPSLPRCLELLSQQQEASEIWSRLEKLRIDDGSVLTMSLCKHLTSMRWLCCWPERSKRGATMMGLTEEQERALQLLTALNRLNFWYLPNLQSLPSNLRNLTSLKTLNITNCPRITRLPEMGLPPSLTELSVHCCSEELCMQCRMAATEKLNVLIDGIRLIGLYDQNGYYGLRVSNHAAVSVPTPLDSNTPIPFSCFHVYPPSPPCASNTLDAMPCRSNAAGARRCARGRRGSPHVTARSSTYSRKCLANTRAIPLSVFCGVQRRGAYMFDEMPGRHLSSVFLRLCGLQQHLADLGWKVATVSETHPGLPASAAAFTAREKMGFVGTVVDAAIGWLVESILGSFTGHMEVWTRETGLTEDVEKLKFEVRNVEMVLAAAEHAASEGRKINNQPLTQSLDDLREQLYDAEDVMDELDYYRLQQQIEKGEGCSADTGNNPEEEDVTDNTMLPPEMKRDISERINGIANNLQKTGNYVREFLKLEISVLRLRSNQGQGVIRSTRLTTSIPIEPKVYGRDAERDKIIQLITNEGSRDLRVLPVVGIGGIGKTTLVRFVYQDERIIDHFDLRMWICVSTNFNEVRITCEMLDHVCKDRQEYKDVANFNVLQEILLKNIRDKRFLLILDDMWEDKDMSGWTTLLAPLKCNQITGCTVLATTRKNSVAEIF
uniref:NB-ARC domain-containing protein n=1 Tax=Leersia perrieri TaxID=77586 RepID=A0A0D9W9N2_9ORYZ